jgi:predicted ATPase
MKLKRIQVKNYKSLKDVTVDFLDLTVLIGKNDTGKSSILRALDILFKWRESRDALEVSGSGGGTELEWNGDIRDYRLFHRQVPSVIEMTCTLELSDGEKATIFPESEFTVTLANATSRHSTESLGRDVVLCKSIVGRDENRSTWQVNWLKLGPIELVRQEPQHRILRRIEPGNYAYERSGEEKGLQLLDLMRNALLVVPAVRSLRTEKRGSEAPQMDGTRIPSTFLRYEKEAPLRKKETFEEIRSKISEMFPRYAEISSMEDGEGGVDIHFQGLPSSSVGDGIKQQFITVFHIKTHPRSIIAVEEPEIHAHPELQRAIFNLLSEESSRTQIVITTHSPVFASSADLNHVRLVTLNSEGSTSVEPVTEQNVQRVIEELGVRPSDFFDDDIVVFVEGADDVRIFRAFARKLASSTRISFIDAEGCNSMAYYANAKVLMSKRLKIALFVIFDGDTEKEAWMDKIKSRLLKQLNLDPKRVVTLSKTSIEDYLLVPRAIKEAFPAAAKSSEEIQTFLDHRKDKKNKKEVLDLLFREIGVGKYSSEKAARIVERMKRQEIDSEIQCLIKTMAEAAE